MDNLFHLLLFVSSVIYSSTVLYPNIAFTRRAIANRECQQIKQLPHIIAIANIKPNPINTRDHHRIEVN